MQYDGRENWREAASPTLSVDRTVTASRSGSAGFSPFETDTPQKPPRDFKRTILIVGLGALSWVATYVGMLELIEANMGDLPLIHRLIIGFSVAMLMTMIIWLLDQLFKPHAFLTKVSYAGGYIFLSLISIGFGFGFYWKVLESRGESSRSAESAVSQVENALHGASTRLEQLQSTLIQLTQVSTDKASMEREKGTSCPNSRPGDGPRRKMREEDAQRFSFASEFVKGRIGAVKGEMTALNGDLAKIVSADASTFDPKTGTRNEFMRALGRKLDLTVTGFNAFRSDPQLRQIRSDLADRAERTTFGDSKNGSISCPDAQLQMALRGVVKAIDQLPELEKPEIAAVEGSEATIEAFRRLTATFYGLLAFKMPPSADELRELQKRAVQSVENPDAPEVKASARALQGETAGLSKRDYVPLAVAVFVDLCLFLVSMAQRPTGRLEGLVPKMKEAERGPVIEILSRFNEIHRDRQVRENFEIFRHVVFDMNGEYYVAVPLDAPPRVNPEEREDLRVEAQLLANLFASFEREKIFKRTLLPTRSSIEKRLRRQGSKFAGAEAYRVYKFTNGAWSDIILGAVMGAARRSALRQTAAVETAQRTESTTTAPHHSTASVPPSPRDIAEPDVAAQTREFTPAPAPSISVDPEHNARFGPYANRYRPQSASNKRDDETQIRRAARTTRIEPDLTINTAANTNRSMDAAHPAPQTAQQTYVPPPPPMPDFNSARSTVVAMPPRSTRAAAVDTADQQETAADRMASVTLKRETATFSVPVNETIMPQSLKAALDAVQHNMHGQASLEKLPSLTPPPLPVQEIDNEFNDETEDFDKNENLTAADLALLRRMAPPAAE